MTHPTMPVPASGNTEWSDDVDVLVIGAGMAGTSGLDMSERSELIKGHGAELRATTSAGEEEA